MSAIVAQVEGRQVRLTSLTRVMYPSMRITKSQVIDYYATVGPSIIGQTFGRPVTRIRFPHGVGGQSFFEKNAPDGIPEWVHRCSAGSLAWAGLFNTYFWVDPNKRVTGTILTQLLPFADDQVLKLFAKFESGLYAAIA